MKDVYILDPDVEWNTQQGTGYFYQDAIFRAEIRDPYTIFQAPHPVEVWFDGVFAYEAYEGDLILPPKSPVTLELKIPSWVFYERYVPPGSGQIEFLMRPLLNAENHVRQYKFRKKFILKKGIIDINNTNKIYTTLIFFNIHAVDNININFHMKQLLFKHSSALFYIHNGHQKRIKFYLSYSIGEVELTTGSLIYYDDVNSKYITFNYKQNFNDINILLNNYEDNDGSYGIARIKWIS